MSMPSFRDNLKSVIVKIARNILANEGLEGLQARKVATAADCSVGTIYNLFGSLDMLVIAANAETLIDLRKVLIEAKETKSNLNDQLDALANAYLEFAVTRTPEWRALFEHRPSTEINMPQWYQQLKAELYAVVEELLQPAIEAKTARTETAHALFSAVHGVVTIALDQNQKSGDFDRLATERQVQFVVKSIAQGINDNHHD